MRRVRLTPGDFGLEEVDPGGLAGGDAAHNAAALRRVLAGDGIGPGEPLRAVHNAAVMTAALALDLLDAGTPLSSLAREAERASAALHDGRAALALHRLGVASRSAADADLGELSRLDARDFAGLP